MNNKYRFKRHFSSPEPRRNHFGTPGYKKPKNWLMSMSFLVTPVIIILAVLFGIKLFKQFGTKLGLLEPPDTKSIRQYYEDGRIKTTVEAQKQKEQIFNTNPPTKTAQQALECAEGIYNIPNFKHVSILNTNGPGELSTDERKDFYNYLVRVNNDADVLQIINAFGERTRYIMGFIPWRTKNLGSYVSELLGKDYIRDLNNYYSGKKIKFAF